MNPYGKGIDLLKRLTLRMATPAFIASIGIGLITSLLLFVSPYIGVADNGDFFRVAYSNGLYYLPHYDTNYFGYFVRQYGILSYYNENAATYFSSQSLFIQLAIFINKLCYSTTIFDIRFQAVIYTVLLMMAVYLLVEALTCGEKRLRGYIVAALAVFIFGDSSYTEYFNSFYSESVMYLSLLFVVASVLLLYRHRYNDMALLFLYTVSAVVFVTAKQQNAPLAIILALFGASFLFFNHKKSFRWTLIALMAVVIGSGIITYKSISGDFNTINQFQALTRGVLLNSHDPEGSLQSIGIDRQYALLKGNIYYKEYTTVSVDSPELREGFYNKYNFVSIAIYYLGHPDQFLDLLNTAARHWFDVRPAAMGNYERGTGQMFRAHTSFFSLYNTLRAYLAPGKFGFVLVFALVVFGCYLYSFIKALRQGEPRLCIRFVLIFVLLLLGVGATMMALIGDGDADLSKHLFVFPISFDCILFLFLSSIITGRLFQNHAFYLPESRAAGRRDFGGTGQIPVRQTEEL